MSLSPGTQSLLDRNPDLDWLAADAGALAKPLRFREPVNGFLHLAAFAIAGVAALALLKATAGLGWGLQAAVAVYGLSMMACFLGSSLHHLVVGSQRLEQRLLPWDQALIFPFIAGSYTPVCVGLLPPPGGLWLLAVLWAMAALGVGYRLGFAPDPASMDEAIPCVMAGAAFVHLYLWVNLVP